MAGVCLVGLGLSAVAAGVKSILGLYLQQQESQVLAVVFDMAAVLLLAAAVPAGHVGLTWEVDTLLSL
jgi:hypothetical protein